MANHKSALKRVRSSEKRREHNKYYHKTMRNALRDVRSTEKKKDAEKQVPALFAMIDKLVKRNIIHKNKANNLKSGVARHLNGLS